MALYFGYKKNVSDTEEIKKSISALKSSLATNNEKTKALETKSTFEATKISTLETKMSTAETDITNIKSTNSTQNTDIQNNWVKSITNGQTADWAKNKANSNASNITSLAGRITTVEGRKKIYTYHFVFSTLSTAYLYPTHKFGTPNYWMYCKGLTRASKFHIHNLVHDSDASIPYDYVFTFQLDFFDTAHNHHTFTLPTVTKRDKAITGENLLFIDERYDLSSVTNLTTCIMARLAVKGSSSKGNEFTVSCSFEI